MTAPSAYTAAQLAERWNVSVRHVKNLAARGELGYFRFGALLRFSQADVKAYEAQQWHAPVSRSPISTSLSETADITFGGGTAPGRDAYQRAQAIFGKRGASSSSTKPAPLSPPSRAHT